MQGNESRAAALERLIEARRLADEETGAKTQLALQQRQQLRGVVSSRRRRHPGKLGNVHRSEQTTTTTTYLSGRVAFGAKEGRVIPPAIRPQHHSLRPAQAHRKHSYRRKGWARSESGGGTKAGDVGKRSEDRPTKPSAGAPPRPPFRYYRLKGGHGESSFDPYALAATEQQTFVEAAEEGQGSLFTVSDQGIATIKGGNPALTTFKAHLAERARYLKLRSFSFFQRFIISKSMVRWKATVREELFSRRRTALGHGGLLQVDPLIQPQLRNIFAMCGTLSTSTVIAEVFRSRRRGAGTAPPDLAGLKENVERAVENARQITATFYSRVHAAVHETVELVLLHEVETLSGHAAAAHRRHQCVRLCRFVRLADLLVERALANFAIGNAAELVALMKRVSAAAKERQKHLSSGPEMSIVQLQQAFLDADEDDSGTLDAKEVEGILREAFSEATNLPSLLERFMTSFDSDGDGSITWDECRFPCSLLSRLEWSLCAQLTTRCLTDVAAINTLMSANKVHDLEENALDLLSRATRRRTLGGLSRTLKPLLSLGVEIGPREDETPIRLVLSPTHNGFLSKMLTLMERLVEVAVVVPRVAVHEDFAEYAAAAAAASAAAAAGHGGVDEVGLGAMFDGESGGAEEHSAALRDSIETSQAYVDSLEELSVLVLQAYDDANIFLKQVRKLASDLSQHRWAEVSRPAVKTMKLSHCRFQAQERSLEHMSVAKDTAFFSVRLERVRDQLLPIPRRNMDEVRAFFPVAFARRCER